MIQRCTGSTFVVLLLCLALLTRCGSSSIVVSGDVDTPEMAYARGLRFLESGAYDQAQDAFERARTLNADYAPAYEGLSRVAFARGNTAEATRLIRTAKIKDAGFAPAWIATGVMYNSVDRHQEALLEFQEALRHDPDKLWAVTTYVHLGRTYEQINMLEQAHNAYTEALRLDTLNLETRTALARVEKALGPAFLNNPWQNPSAR